MRSLFNFWGTKKTRVNSSIKNDAHFTRTSHHKPACSRYVELEEHSCKNTTVGTHQHTIACVHFQENESCIPRKKRVRRETRARGQECLWRSCTYYTNAAVNERASPIASHRFNKEQRAHPTDADAPEEAQAVSTRLDRTRLRKLSGTIKCEYSYRLSRHHQGM